jgi:hypothetical protein
MILSCNSVEGFVYKMCGSNENDRGGGEVKAGMVVAGQQLLLLLLLHSHRWLTSRGERISLPGSVADGQQNFLLYNHNLSCKRKFDR